MNQKQSLQFRFEEASKVLPVHNNTKTYDIFYKGFKFSKDKEKGTFTIYAIHSNYKEIKKDKELYDWFRQFPFTYVCDMLMIRRNFGKLFTIDRRLVKDLDCKDFFLLRKEVIRKIKNSLSIISEYEK